MKAKKSWIEKVGILSLLGVCSVYAICNNDVDVKCMTVTGPCLVQSPNCYDNYLGENQQPTYVGSVSESSSRSAVTGVDWEDPNAWGYDAINTSAFRNCSYTCVIAYDCLDLSPEVAATVSVQDITTAGELCGPYFN